MLYQIGPVQVDTFPFSIDGFEREASADFADHALLSRRKSQEPVGLGEETITLKGKILPFREMMDGRAELATLEGVMIAQEPVFVMRGDGSVLGWFVVLSIKESHENIMRNGVPFVLGHEFKLKRVDEGGVDAALGLIDSLASLFG